MTTTNAHEAHAEGSDDQAIIDGSDDRLELDPW